MTGKDLIIYILQNDLEDVSVIGIVKKVLLTENQLDAKFDVGVDTIRVWQTLKLINGIKVGGSVYYYNDTPDPRGIKSL